MLTATRRPLRVSVGKLGSTDRVILRVNAGGLYVSVRPRRTRRYFLAAGANYDLTAGIR